MELFLHTLSHSFLDTVKMLPFLLIAFLILEFIESKSSHKTVHIIEKSGKFGPILGSALGLIPQCGFSVVGANFYSKRIITVGTLVAIFLSTSDEAFLVMLSNPQKIPDLLIIIALKFVIGVVFGYLIDFLFSERTNKSHHDHHDDDDMAHDHCCYNHSVKEILWCALKRTFSVFAFVLFVTFALTLLIELFGEDKLHSLLLTESIFQPLLTALIGLIPNCAPSIVLSQMYLDGALSLGSVVAGLCTSAGVGTLVLFKQNKPQKDNLKILSLLYVISAISGFLIELIA